MFKIAVAQLNPKVGDLEGNFKMIMDAYRKAARAGADMIVMPECVLTGYPLEDLVLRESFMREVDEVATRVWREILAMGKNTTLIYGAPSHAGHGAEIRPQNRAYIIDPLADGHGHPKVWSVSKIELPNYGVFDEKRVFRSGSMARTVNWRGHRIGLMICEDGWFPHVARDLYDDGADFIISINGSPFEVGKNVTRRKVVAERIKETGLAFLYVNLVGGQDELVFDGGSFLYDGKGVQEAPSFKEGITYFQTDFGIGDRAVTLDNYPEVEPSGLGAIYQACVLGLRDYMRKQGFKSAVLGYSGGVDSGLVAAIACDAIGAENVHLVRLPSGFSSQHSLDDAAAGAERLGAPMRTIPIENVVDALRDAYHHPYRNLEDTSDTYLTGVADENIQARARGNILMAISNQEGHLLLTTGNKSEVSVGYATLYGDMSGGFNPIKDCYKTTVWDLCRWRNGVFANELAKYGFLGRGGIDVVPEEIIVKPPSAELRPDQKDEDSLPPYPVLDAILKAFIEDEKGVFDVVNQLKIDYDTVLRIRKLVDNAEYKRRQAAPGVKITSKIHGRDRRYPIVNGWRG